MDHLLSKAGRKYIDVIVWYMKRIVKWEFFPSAYSTTRLIAIWKRKGPALDLNMMRFVHSREWEAGLCK